MDNLVITISGKKVPKSKARKISDCYYLIGNNKVKDSGDCYKLGNRYYLATSQKLAWNLSTEEYTKRDDVTRVIGEDGELGYGNYHPKTSRTTRYSGTVLPIIAKKTYLCHGDGLYYLSKRDNTPYYIGLPENVHHNKNLTVHGYNYADSPYADIFEQEFIDSNMKVTNLAKKIAKDVPYTFGIELEADWGRIPEHKLYELFLLPVKDGSVNAEYVSTIMSGKKGIQTILNYKDIGYLRANNTTSLHFHFGNIINTNFTTENSKYQFKKTVVALYQMWYQIQRDIWAICPPYKNDSEFFHKVKQGKNHCMNLPNLNERWDLSKKVNVEKYFEKIFTLFHEGQPSSEDYNFVNRNHIKGNANKWNFKSRYYNLNFWNLFFSNSRTLEFRAFAGTFNYQKILCYFLVCNSIIKYTTQNVDEVLSIRKYDVQDLFNIYDKDIEEMLSEFVAKRNQEHFKVLASYNAAKNKDEFNKDSEWNLETLNNLINDK